MKIRVWLEPGHIPHDNEDVVEVPDAEWASLSEDRRRAFLDETYEEHLAQFVSGGVEVVEEGE